MSGYDEDDSDEEPALEVGYRRPPVSTRFQKGKSGNPRGRPRNRQRQVPHDGVLGQMVTIREDGRERRVTAAEAFLLQLTQKGLAGDSAAARSSLDAIEKARTARHLTGPEHVDVLTISFVGMGIEAIIGTLGIAKKKYPRNEQRVRWELDPWIVEAAVVRLGQRQLSVEKQREVFDNTRLTQNIAWPAWWTVRE